MAILETIENYLDDMHAPFARRSHPQIEQISERKLAKTVVLLVDGSLAMAVLPADDAINVQELARELGASHLRPATDAEIAHLLPECESGAMPPFGNLYGVPVYAENRLARQDTIAFSAGTCGEVIYMSFADFRRTVGPMVLSFARSESVPQLAAKQWYGGRQP